jgi:tetratricopeptide (TPR) repeat protein
VAALPINPLVILTVFLGGALPLGHGAPMDATLASAWRDASLSLFKSAHADFSTLTGPDAELGRALTLLVLQPKTKDNLDQSAALLRGLAENPEAAHLAPAALYYLARIEQVHRPVADPEAARAYYQRLIEAYPKTLYGELGVVKRAVLDLYEPVSDETRRARFDALLTVAARLEIPATRRDLSLILADTAQAFGYGDAVALPLLLQADQAGITRPSEQATVWIRIAETAVNSGRPDIARDHYQRYLAAFRRDNRRHMVKEKLGALEPAAP